MKNPVKILNFMTINAKRITNDSKKTIDNNKSEINNYKNIMKTYQVKSLLIHKAKSRKTNNYTTKLSTKY